ncbi:MAG: hypothetical protein ACK5MQ_02765 [Pikeienuella sp.]
MATPRKLKDFGELTPAERKVLAELDSGELTVLGDGERPAVDAGPDRLIRPAFLRWCALGADEEHRVHETGVRISGALIANDTQADKAGWKNHLDLAGCALNFDLGLENCLFAVAPVLRSVVLRNLFLNGSELPGLRADRLRATGSAFFRKIKTIGEFRLVGANIEGNLSFVGAVFLNVGGKAVSANRLQVGGGVFLRDGARISGILNLTGANISAIVDDPVCWPEPGDLRLNRCRYGAFHGKGVSAEERIRWLTLQDPSRFGEGFWPQPWEQCAKVLRDMGHPKDAREVLIEKERLQRQDARRRLEQQLREARLERQRISADGPSNAALAAQAPIPPLWLLLWTTRFRDALLAVTIRYGHRPFGALWWLGGFWLVGACLFLAAYNADAMKPKSPVVLRSAEWALCAAQPETMVSFARGAPAASRRRAGESRIGCFLAAPEGAGYPAFNAALYSADVILPLFDLEQQAHWVPDSTQGGGLGKWAMAFVYIEIIAGWALSLLAVAGFSGLVKKE